MTVRGVNVVGGQLYDVGAHGGWYEGRGAQGVQMEFGVQWIRFLKKKKNCEGCLRLKIKLVLYENQIVNKHFDVREPKSSVYEDINA